MPGSEHDSEPLGRRDRRRSRWTTRGAGLLSLGLGLLAVGLWWRYPGLVALGVGCTALAGLGLLSVTLPAPVAVDRAVRPREVTRNEPCRGVVRLRHVGRVWPVHLDAVDLVDGEQIPTRVPVLYAGERTMVDYPIPTVRRGMVEVGPLLLRRRGLAGLATSTVTLGGVTQVRVLPRRHPVWSLPAGLRRGHVGTAERLDHGGTNLVGLREYVPGDDLRRLHWATSARLGTLMVREDADPSTPQLAVLLDDLAASYEQTDFEEAVEVAWSLVWATVSAGHSVRLRTTSTAVDTTVDGVRGCSSTVAAAGVGGGPGPSQLTGDEGATAQALHGVAVALTDLTATAATTPPVRLLSAQDRQVLAVVSGSAADLGGLVRTAAAAAVGLVLVVDPSSAGEVTTAGRVTVVRAARAVELLTLWNRVVAG